MGKRSETRQRTALVALRFLPAERDTLTRAAADRGCSVSELIRSHLTDILGGD